jgi:hypothetical protein
LDSDSENNDGQDETLVVMKTLLLSMEQAANLIWIGDASVLMPLLVTPVLHRMASAPLFHRRMGLTFPLPSCFRKSATADVLQEGC